MTVQTNPAGFEVGINDKIHIIKERMFCVKVKDFGAESGCVVLLLEGDHIGWGSVDVLDDGLDTRLGTFGGSAVNYVNLVLLPKLKAALAKLFSMTPTSSTFTFADVDAEIQKITMDGIVPKL